MKRKNTSKAMFIFAISIMLGSIYLLSIVSTDTYFEGNVRRFSLMALQQKSTNMDCDVYNQISITYDDNQKVTLANGRQGILPYIDSSVPLDLSHGGKDVKTTHFEVALDCKGNAMKGSTVVSGTIKARICGDPSYAGTTCIAGAETPISKFDSFSFGNTALNPSVKKVIFSRDFSESELNTYFNTGSGTIFFKFESFPILTFNFIHPTAGSFSGSYNAESENSKVIAQYGSISNFQTAPTQQQQLGKGLKINYWSPQILDKSKSESQILVGIGIENLESNEPVPTLKVTDLNSIIKEEFELHTSCKTLVTGWKNCETTITLNKSLYAKGSYKIILSSTARTGSVSVPLEVVDQTPDSFTSNPPINFTKETQDATSDFINFINGQQQTTTTDSGAKITRSINNFNFGSDDIIIIMVLVGITGGIGLFAKYRKKLK